MRSFLLLAALGNATAQLLGNTHANHDANSCTIRNFSERTDETDAVCCSGPNLAADACVNGVPTNCDVGCAVILIPWFEDCSTIISQIAADEFTTYQNAYNRCKQADAPDQLAQIHALQERGCTVQLPHGTVVTTADAHSTANACNNAGRPVVIERCSASSEYSADYSCDHTFDANFEDKWYGTNDVRDTAGSSSSWAVRGGDDNRPWIQFDFGHSVEIGSMTYAQRTNVASECFKDIQLAFDGGAVSNTVLQCASDSIMYSFPAVTTQHVRITMITIYADATGRQVWLNPGAREIQFFEFAGVHQAPLPLVLPPSGFAPGASLACYGTWDANDEGAQGGRARFSLNFNIDDDNTALHINPRREPGSTWCPHCMVRNTKRNGLWDSGTDDWGGCGPASGGCTYFDGTDGGLLESEGGGGGEAEKNGFQFGKPFVLQVDALEDSYHIHVDSLGDSGDTYGSGFGSNLEVGEIHNGVACDDQAFGQGYMMYTQTDVHQRFLEHPVHGDNAEHFVCVVWNEETQGWEYDDNDSALGGGQDSCSSGGCTGTFTHYPFTPDPKTDFIVGIIDFGTVEDPRDQTIADTKGLNYDLHGLRVGYDDGDLVWTPNRWGSTENDGEFGLTGTFISMRLSVGQHVNVGETHNGIACDDDASGTGYIMYSEDSVHNRFSDFPPHASNADHFVCVVWRDGGWAYDDNEGAQGAIGIGGDWTVYPFTPAATDVLVATVDFGSGTVLDDSTVTVGAGQSSEVHGIHLGYADGDLAFTPNLWGGSFNAGEFGVEGTWFSTNGGICEGVYDCTHADLSGNVHVDYFDGAGSTGDGFCNFDLQGDTATYALRGCASQQVLVRFRYALGFLNNREMTLTVNGNVVANYDLSPTGAWSTWEYTGSELVTLQQGDNAVSITQATSDEPANIDLMEVFSVDSDTVFDTTFKYRLDPAAVTSITGEDSTISYCDYTPPPGTCPAPPPPGSGHRRSQMFGDGVLAGDMCGLDTIADRADQVSGACCASTSTGGSACDAQGALPTSCTYQCAATYVPFFDECQHVLVDTFGDQLTAYRNLYSTCVPDDPTILMQAVNSAQCAGRSMEWRIEVNSVVGGGPQVQLTEIGLLNGNEQLGAAIIQPTITPQGGWPDGPSHVLSCTNCPNCEQCLNDENPHSGTANCNPLPCIFEYHYDHPLTPTGVRLALHDDPNRFPSAVTISYYDSTAANWAVFDELNQIPTPHSEVFVDIQLDGAMVGIGSTCASAPTSPEQIQVASNADMCCDGHGTDPVAGMQLRTYSCARSNDLWQFDAQGHIVDAIGDSNFCFDIVNDGPDIQLNQCQQADTWELAWSTTTDTFQIHSTTHSELCLFSYSGKTAWRALPCDEAEPAFDFVAMGTNWVKPSTCR